MSQIRVACVQMRSGRNVADNIGAAVSLIRDAARQGAELIATPEMTTLLDRKPGAVWEGSTSEDADLEASLLTLTGGPISGAVVFAVSQPEQDDEVVAVVEVRAGGRTPETEDVIRRRIREAAGLELSRVVLASPGTIPRTTSGKVRRAETRERLESGELDR